MPAPAMPTIFTDIATSMDTMLIASMDAIISSGLASMRPQIALALSLYIIGFAALTVFGKTDIGAAAMAAVRALVVAQILRAASYTSYVRDFFFTDLPNTIAAALGGPRSGISSAQQFDLLWSAALHATSIVLGQATGFTMMLERGVAWIEAGAMLVALGAIFLVWLIARVFMAIVICLGVFIILLFLFSATRGFVEQWIGKLVGLIVLQITSSILLRIVLVVISDKMRAMGAAPPGDVDAMLAQLGSIAAVYWIGAALMIVLPSFFAIGSGVSAGAVVAAGHVSRFASGAGRAVVAPFRHASRS
ncbi:type IV secretion system protein [Muricoccus pecuniae]|uniref:Type IV secretory pathway VirB6-like protein n=1 Tax=Muricoccus pecuniae TaxID=693023 RepID=A0A840Y5N7_9PROT|nr:type IV secretion system protein [Roseomonas pecuniae]MBB5696055.1 type IV secretory pathway VirB6-like protein [Roseomonas pecuniae]